MEQINDLGKAAGSISAILGLLALIALNPIKKHLHKRRAQRESLAQARAEAERKEHDDEAAFREEIRAGLQSINSKLAVLTDDIGDLQYERLSQAQEFYTQQGWCPGSKKEMLCQMHKSYRSKGRNHLSEHYEEEILSLESRPREVMGNGR